MSKFFKVSIKYNGETFFYDVQASDGVVAKAKGLELFVNEAGPVTAQDVQAKPIVHTFNL